MDFWHGGAALILFAIHRTSNAILREEGRHRYARILPPRTSLFAVVSAETRILFSCPRGSDSLAADENSP
jgi:hypothetical protein